MFLVEIGEYSFYFATLIGRITVFTFPILNTISDHSNLKESIMRYNLRCMYLIGIPPISNTRAKPKQNFTNTLHLKLQSNNDPELILFYCRTDFYACTHSLLRSSIQLRGTMEQLQNSCIALYFFYVIECYLFICLSNSGRVIISMLATTCISRVFV